MSDHILVIDSEPITGSKRTRLCRKRAGTEATYVIVAEGTYSDLVVLLNDLGGKE